MKKKIFIIIGVVVVVFFVAQISVLGIYGGMGPLGFIKDKRIHNMAGNQPQYDFDKIEAIDSPLKGKRIAILGSSVARGDASEEYAVGEYLAARLDCTVDKEAVNGTTLVDNGDESYIQRMLHNMDASKQYDLFICQLSTNDASKKLPLGTVSDSVDSEEFDTSTVTGGMEYIISYAQKTWDCPVVFFTGSHYESDEYEQMVKNLYLLQDKWEIGILDLWNDTEFNDISDENRKLYMKDSIHPTKAGYRDWWGPEQEKQLLEFLEEK